MIVSNVLITLFLIALPGGIEWIVIVLVVVLLFGGRKIPELMRGIGKGINEFNKTKNISKKEFEKGRDEGTPEEVKDGIDEY